MSEAAASGQGIWSRRVIAPLAAQLTLGVAPERLAGTVAVGVACALFPLLGATTVLTAVVGVRLRMNQVILHTINQLLGPVQLTMIIVYLRAGEWIWRVPRLHFSITELVMEFHGSGVSVFLKRFGMAGVHAVTAWAVSAPFLLALLYVVVRGPMHRLATLRALPAAAA